MSQKPIVPPIRESSAWAALVIARIHRFDQEREDGVWTCECRCCRYWEQLLIEQVKPDFSQAPAELGACGAILRG